MDWVGSKALLYYHSTYTLQKCFHAHPPVRILRMYSHSTQKGNKTRSARHAIAHDYCAGCSYF